MKKLYSLLFILFAACFLVSASSRADEAEQQWKLLGTGKYTDDIMTSAEMESRTWEVEIYESETTPGFYRVENPYGNGKCPYFEKTFECCDFLLHAENPDAVWMEYVELKSIDFGLTDDEYCPAYIAIMPVTTWLPGGLSLMLQLAWVWLRVNSLGATLLLRPRVCFSIFHFSEKKAYRCLPI